MAEVQTRIYWLHALTGVHVGAGAGVGAVDLPIVREKVTEWPYIPGSSFKGVLAAYHKATDDSRKAGTMARAAFGSADNDTDVGNNSGALMFTDARLVCLPVASFFGTFAWTTCWFALRRLARDLKAAGVTKVPAFPAKEAEQAAVVQGTALTESPQKQQVYLGDFDFTASPSPEAAEWATFLAARLFPGDAAWSLEFERRFTVLPQDYFNHFARYACEVVTRIKIDGATRTVQGGALWLEEMLPAESILAGIVVCDRIYQKDTTQSPSSLISKYCAESALLQFGGKATVGRGRVQVRFSGKDAS